MASVINVTVPATSSSLVSAAVRTNFAAAANEITALQNRTDSLQNSITLVQNQVTPLQASVTALQTKTNVSGDGGLAANGALTVAGLRGRTLATAAPTNGQVLTWVQGSNAWTPTTPAGGAGAVMTGVAPPASPGDGQLWWDPTGGGLYVWYNDGSSSQWVTASPSGGGGGTGGGSGLPLAGGTLSGALGINTSGAANLPAPPAGTVMQLASPGNTTATIDAAGAVQVPRLQLRRAGGTLDSLQPVPNSAQIGMLEWLGWTGAAWAGANIQCVSTAAWNTGSAPMRMNFMTTQAGSVLPSLAVYIGSSGGFVAGSTTPGGDRGPGTINAQAVYCVGDLNVGGEIYRQGVALELGPPDSAGTGFRALRVAN